MSLQSIVFVVLSGSVICAISLIAFGFAVRRRSIFIAPRCTARPPDTIYAYSAKHAAQRRGNAWLGWVTWTLSLSYDTMLGGIPGTGTRSRGMKGTMLSVNMDAIVLFRFHALCLRVGVLATILGLCVILPLNYTASCWPDASGPDCPSDIYDRTTLVNIPNITHTYSSNETKPSSTRSETTPSQFVTSFTQVFWNEDPANLNALVRLYTIVACSFIVTYYMCHQISHEWRDALGLRRAFYLEADHHMNRMAELKMSTTPLSNEADGCSGDERSDASSDDDDSDSESDDNGVPASMKRRRAINKAASRQKRLKKARSRKSRDPWIPHPEQRDTVPNIELYSVLVGGLPVLPSDCADQEQMKSLGKRYGIDWQMLVTAAFFDHCVPNQPGFSSSVAAVTILPAAPALAKAWRRWYKAAAALRRLRFIRSIIADRRSYDIGAGDLSSVADESKDVEFDPESCRNLQVDSDDVENQHDASSSRDNRLSYFSEVFGDMYNEEVESRLFEMLDYGPEQTAVYSRESAQGAANCCPNGCCEGRVKRSRIDELLAMERDAVAAVHEANIELGRARCNAGYRDSDINPSVTKKTDDAVTPSSSQLEQEHEQIMTHHTMGSFPRDGDITKMSTQRSQQIGSMPSYNKERLRSYLGDEARVLEKYQNNLSSTDMLTETPPVSNKSISMKISRSSSPPKRMSKSTPPLRTIPKPKPLSSGDKVTSIELSALAPPLPPSIRTSTPRSHISDHRSSKSIPQNYNCGNSLCQYMSMSLNSDGKFITPGLVDYENDENDDQQSFTSSQVVVDGGDASQGTIIERNGMVVNNGCKISAMALSTSRQFTSSDFWNIKEVSPEWQRLESINRDSAPPTQTQSRQISTGEWFTKSHHNPYSSSLSPIRETLLSLPHRFIRWMKRRPEKVVDEWARDSTFAVITFTNRQAAVAARHCIADGRGLNTWLSVTSLPTPPLADAASCDIVTCRGCCRPVTMSINSRQQLIRKFIAISLLIVIFIFYTVPLTYAAQLMNPERLSDIPAIYQFLDRIGVRDALSGLVQASLYTLFFALCPVMFRAIANFGSNATSVSSAEMYAMQYYWWFMLVTAFAGTSFVTMAINALGKSNANFSEVLFTIAKTLPTQMSATWINWIIVRTFIVLPTQYLLQVNTYLFWYLGWKCCARCVMGGGPGGPVPYRIYIDTGVVLMCTVSLSYASPLIAPFALVYFLVCQPLWRRNCIYLYRPKFDGGGFRWPFLSDMCLSGLMLGHVLLATMLLLKEAIGPAIFAALQLVPTIMFRRLNHAQYWEAYMDAGLLQTSLLDTWDTHNAPNPQQREAYRQWLVDAHKAAYIPVCVAGDANNVLTCEPAIVIQREDELGAPVPMPQRSFSPQEMTRRMMGMNGSGSVASDIDIEASVDGSSHAYASCTNGEIRHYSVPNAAASGTLSVYQNNNESTRSLNMISDQSVYMPQSGRPQHGAFLRRTVIRDKSKHSVVG